jgi:hypothetical protein
MMRPNKSQRSAPFAGEKPMADWKMAFANLWSRQRITKKAYAGHGLESKWEIPNNTL